MPVFGGLAIVGERVRIAGAGHGRQQLEQRLRVTQLVLGQRAHRDVLFELRGDPRPLRIGEPDDELVVRHRAQQLVEAVDRRGGVGRGGQPGRRAHVARAFGFSCPAADRAAASLSRMT